MRSVFQFASICLSDCQMSYLKPILLLSIHHSAIQFHDPAHLHLYAETLALNLPRNPQHPSTTTTKIHQQKSQKEVEHPLMRNSGIEPEAGLEPATLR